jgi:hypothetical protein
MRRSVIGLPSGQRSPTYGAEMNGLAPIALFIFRRPEHLQRTLDTLARCPELRQSPVHVFGDGPRNEDDRAGVRASRQVAKAFFGDRAQYHFSDHNRGLARSIIEGVQAVLTQYKRVIVLEDDLELDARFLSFMNEALTRYENEPRVLQVSGYMFDFRPGRSRSSPYFLPFPSSWGWATWLRAWETFDTGARGWQQLHNDRALRRKFDLDGVYGYSNMLHATMTGQRDSWAVRWYWSIFKNAGLVAYPPQTLVRNSGFDGSGTHGRAWLRRFGRPSRGSTPVSFDLSAAPAFAPGDYADVKRAIWRQNGGSLGHAVDGLRRVLGRLRVALQTRAHKA